MDMNKTFYLKNENIVPKWRVIDAKGKVLGRLATEIADALRGKDQAYYTPHTDSGDNIIVINAAKVRFTGNKLKDKTYEWYTGWIGGLKSLTLEQMMAKEPERVIHLAVKGMMAHNRLCRAQLKKLHVYVGAEHPHIAQVKHTQALQKTI